MTQTLSKSTPAISEAAAIKSVDTPDLKLSDIFYKDPTLVTDAELDALVLVLREKRNQWNKEDLESKSQGRRANYKSQGTAKPSDVDVNLGDLGL